MYRETIRSAFKEPLRSQLTDDDLRAVEDIMRHAIFHSTLDWQTKGQLQRAAREAWPIVQELRKEGLLCPKKTNACR